MKTTGRNDPCPCGSGKKYKKCCLADDEQGRNKPPVKVLGSIEELKAEIEELDDLSNSVVTLINDEKWEEAEEACRKLRRKHPDQVDGIWRMAMVDEARGNRAAAAKAYREAAEFMRTHDGFDDEGIADMIASAERLES